MEEDIFDVFIFHDQEDSNARSIAEKLQQILISYVRLQDEIGNKRSPSVRLMYEKIKGHTNTMQNLEETFDKASYVFILLTKGFSRSNRQHLVVKECVIESLLENNKRSSSVVLIQTLTRQEIKTFNWSLPFGLRTIEQIDVSKLVRGKKLNELVLDSIREEDLRSETLEKITILLQLKEGTCKERNAKFIKSKQIKDRIALEGAAVESLKQKKETIQTRATQMLVTNPSNHRQESLEGQSNYNLRHRGELVSYPDEGEGSSSMNSSNPEYHFNAVQKPARYRPNVRTSHAMEGPDNISESSGSFTESSLGNSSQLGVNDLLDDRFDDLDASSRGNSQHIKRVQPADLTVNPGQLTENITVYTLNLREDALRTPESSVESSPAASASETPESSLVSGMFSIGSKYSMLPDELKSVVSFASGALSVLSSLRSSASSKEFNA